ncbi:Asp-tRNA(Asn)/Glu-tRNA(Gln) amidotransferase GatCAB subunit B [Candidatus Kaiserbacteria bacterium]|nr:MAG: Asp-tRNA(Asn)/Glu-tRNA(Gln) amidotransferase GatCAB subunit B [Candidatus Kaiserbacteria bacterium]
MAHPGVLPTINKEAVHQVLRVGTAMGGRLADYSEFDRKNYFYPDIPKAYQLSQFEFPLVSGGELRGVELTRIHLEEDTARSSHTSESGSSLVDFNRAGVPLMELVTEPVMHSAEEAGNFGRELRLLLKTLEASNANMEKGEMRVEVNISIAEKGAELGTKVEIKNLNSFKAVEKSIEFEIQRQSELLDSGERVVQETRGWDENKEITFSQRMKEEAADYRFFPEPDLPKLKLGEIEEFNVENLRESLPELPDEKRSRLADAYDLKSEAIEVYVSDKKLSEFFEEVIQNLEGSKEKAKLASNYILNNLVAMKNPEGHITERISPTTFAQVIDLVHDGEVSSNGAVELMEKVVEDSVLDVDVRSLATDTGLLQQNDEAALIAIVDTVLSENTDAVSEFRSGKEQALQYLVGQGMKASKGSANPAKLKEIIKERI